MTPLLIYIYTLINVKTKWQHGTSVCWHIKPAWVWTSYSRSVVESYKSLINNIELTHPLTQNKISYFGWRFKIWIVRNWGGFFFIKINSRWLSCIIDQCKCYLLMIQNIVIIDIILPRIYKCVALWYICTWRVTVAATNTYK